MGCWWCWWCYVGVVRGVGMMWWWRWVAHAVIFCPQHVRTPLLPPAAAGTFSAEKTAEPSRPPASEGTEPMGWYDFYLPWSHTDSHSRCVTTSPPSSWSSSLSASQATGASHQNSGQIFYKISISLWEVTIVSVSDVGIIRAREEKE